MIARRQGVLLVGTSGWIYPHWKGKFYPTDLSEKAFLAYYAERFSTVEINYSFYRLPNRENFEHWADATPQEFTFAVKASRYITHLKKLRDAVEPTKRLLDSAAGLGDKLGPILFQLPPGWKKNIPRLIEFAASLPRNHRYAFEFRDPSWLAEDVYQVLADYQAALVISDYQSLPLPLTLTTDFTYIRLHGGRNNIYYSDNELSIWAERILHFLSEGIHVYVYFNNDPGGIAPRDALALLRKSNVTLMDF